MPKSPALEYHSQPKPGKISIQSTKPLKTRADLSLAYTPGVAEPCLEIQKNPKYIYKYTSKSNMVAVITDGTAVLGLGNIGAEAGLPVMEGKSILFKKFADIDSVPLAIKGHRNIKDLVHIISTLDSWFGGINLEDIKAPECFYVEESLKKLLPIPVFHDDQHGTAIISTAGILNALELANKKISEAKIIVNGAGAAGIACAKMYVRAGAKKSNIFIIDSEGLITKKRKGLNKYKKEFAQNREGCDLEEAIKNADIFIGVSVPNVLTKKMIKSMNQKPIIFALANPVPEIQPDRAKEFGAFIIATGRSDYPNQVNNVLGFPGIFRGALDTRSYTINEEMKLAAVKALIEVTKERFPKSLLEEYKVSYKDDYKRGIFDNKNPLNENYIIPKPFDWRVVPRVARYVAEAAMKSGVAQIKIKNLDEYEKGLIERIN